MTDKFRFVILLLSVICLSMMMANVLTFNFCIICMTREVYDQRYITVNAGKEIFKHINLTLPEVDFIGADTRIDDDNIDDNDQSGDGDDWSNIPDISSVLGLNKVSARLLVENPQLFVKLMKKVLVEVSQLGITELGEAVDSRSVDMQQRIPEFFAGFNLSAFDKESLRGMKEIVCNLIHEGRITAHSISDNITEWRNIDIEEFDLLNVTWDGDVYVRRDILVKKADKYYTHQQRSILFASVAVGALLAIAPISTSIHRYGARKTFTVVGSISAISTGLCPLAASFGVLPLTAMRILQGSF
ncbi:hypothetical protein AB6A40_007882 [Gnathostoma spinigerum]|uniref:Uncharacterized protein n=1 Tax=Gnathostoma spinigerum TaxID=75299 RepID=A0ABD6EMI5_9BILA